MSFQFSMYSILFFIFFSKCLVINSVLLQNSIDEKNILNITVQQIIPNDLKNIIVTNYLDDNNFERILAFKNILVKETNFKGLVNPFKMLQVSDGISLIRLNYSNSNKLLKCDYTHKKELASIFIAELFKEIEYLKTGKSTSVNKILYNNTQLKKEIQNSWPLAETIYTDNSTYKHLKNINDIPNDMEPLLNFENLKLQCNQKSFRKNNRKKRSVSDLLIAPNTKWCGRGHNAENYNELGGASQADKCCRKHDHCKNNIQGMSTKWKLFNFRMYTISHCNCDTRIPGTKWCGKGWDAKKYSDLGGYSKVDQCCRQHDKSCLYWIMGFETKYNFYNWRVNTLMHCKCDERFRTCLKMANTADADLVGKLFFNVVQTKCFVIKSEKICTKRLENGECENTTLRKRAHLRENRKF